MVVTVRKLRPPVPVDMASAAVRISPSRDRPAASGPALAGRRAFVALGSNLGDRWANLRAGLGQLPDVVAALTGLRDRAGRRAARTRTATSTWSLNCGPRPRP